MSSTQVYHDDSYLKEVWGLFGVGVAVLGTRFLVRLRATGWRRFQGDDYMALVVFACYAADAIIVTIIYKKGANVDYRGTDLLQLTQGQVASIVYGSKMQLFVWYTYTALIWGLKACMLFFFNRLTFGLTQQIFVKALGVVCVLTYIAMFLTITLSCLPFHRNWQVRPMPPDKCTFRKHNFYTCTVLNVVTDAAILCIPIPLLWRLKISVPKKLGLGLLFSSGILVITAAIVRNIKTLDAPPSALTMNRWAIRETIAGIIAVNVPILKPMFRKVFWSRGYRLPTTLIVAERSGSAGSCGSKQTGFSRFLQRADAVELVDVSYKTNTTGPHPGIRIDTAPPPPSDDEGDSRMVAMREPVVPRPQRVFKSSIREELDSFRDSPHPGVRIPTPGVREEKQKQYRPDLASPRIERVESVLTTPWPEEQRYNPWGYDAELTNMDSIHSTDSQGRLS